MWTRSQGRLNLFFVSSMHGSIWGPEHEGVGVDGTSQFDLFLEGGGMVVVDNR